MSEHKDTRVRELEAEVERLRAAGTEAVRLGAESRWQVEAENARLREALAWASRALDEVVVYFDGSTRIPPAGFPLASVVRPAQRFAREALEAGER